MISLKKLNGIGLDSLRHGLAGRPLRRLTTGAQVDNLPHRISGGRVRLSSRRGGGRLAGPHRVPESAVKTIFEE